MPSTQIFLKLVMGRQNKQIQGEASAEGYEGLIEVDNFSWGMSSKYALRQGQAKVKPQLNYDKLKITKQYDVSSISMASHMAGHIPFSTAQITVDHHLHETASSKTVNPLMVIELSNGYIEEIRLAVSEGKLASTLREDITLSFINFKITYHPGGAGRMKRLAPMSYETFHRDL